MRKMYTKLGQATWNGLETHGTVDRLRLLRSLWGTTDLVYVLAELEMEDANVPDPDTGEIDQGARQYALQVLRFAEALDELESRR